MRWLFLICACLGAEVVSSRISDLRMVDDLHDCVRVRFETTQTVVEIVTGASEPTASSLDFVFSPPVERHVVTVPALGMSRIASPPSMGRHFQPQTNVTQDFNPENDSERKAVAMLEAAHLQVGLFVFGRAILVSDPGTLDFRALKGPAAITAGTPRPAWSPTAGVPSFGDTDPLPDWNQVYTLARKAMRSFNDGGAGFEADMNSWTLAARPVLASQQKCVTCHNASARPGEATLALNQPIGGVLYAYRRVAVR
jgi:hypothetical protein